MTIYEAASFYGDYSMLLAEISDELSVEEVEGTTTAWSFYGVLSFTIENLVLKVNLGWRIISSLAERTKPSNKKQKKFDLDSK